MNGYICMYKGKKFEVHAHTMYDAQKKGAAHFKVKQAWKVVTGLAEKDNKQVIHKPLF